LNRGYEIGFPGVVGIAAAVAGIYGKSREMIPVIFSRWRNIGFYGEAGKGFSSSQGDDMDPCSPKTYLGRGKDPSSP